MAALLAAAFRPRGPGARACRSRPPWPVRVRVRVYAFSAREPSDRASSHTPSVAMERVLRYPGGRERRIRYPAERKAEEEVDDTDAADGEDSDWWWSRWDAEAPEWGSNVVPVSPLIYRDKPRPVAEAQPASAEPAPSAPVTEDEHERAKHFFEGLWGLDANEGGHHVSEALQRSPLEESEPERADARDAGKRFFDDLWEEPSAAPPQARAPPVSLPDSPAELLRRITSDEFKEAQAEVWTRVKGSYEIMESCPWVMPRQLFCLALGPVGGSPGEHEDGGHSSHTLRCRLEADAGFQDELSKIFKHKPEVAKKFRVQRMVDGLVAFESEDDAARYMEQLEADGHAEVQMAEVDSHKMFRMVQEVKGVVVFLRTGGELPTPAQLKVSLLGKHPTEDL